MKKLYQIVEYAVTFRRIVRIGSEPSVVLPVGGFGLEPSPPCCQASKALQAAKAQNRFLRTLQPATGFLRHILSRKLPFVNPILQCHRHPSFLYSRQNWNILDCASFMNNMGV